MNTINKLAIALLLLLQPSIASAGLVEPITAQDCGLLNINCGGQLGPVDTIFLTITNIGNGLLAVASAITFIVVIYCGVMYVMSRGDESAAGRAKTCLLYAIIGLFILALAGFIVNVTLAIIN